MALFFYFNPKEYKVSLQDPKDQLVTTVSSTSIATAETYVTRFLCNQILA